MIAALDEEGSKASLHGERRDLFWHQGTIRSEAGCPKPTPQPGPRPLARKVLFRDPMNKPIFSLTLSAAVLGATLVAGSGLADDKKPITDAWLTAKTKIALAADSRVKGREVSVETQKATVMLRGKVDDEASKMAAEEITRGIEGVTTVKNELQVVAPSRRDAVDDKDDTINDRVKKQLSTQRATKNFRIGVKTNAGVVSLSGEVKDWAAASQASWTAWQVPGVKSVRNDLSVKEI